MPIHRNYNKDFFKTWTPEMAYVLGYFAADGCMVANSQGGYFIEFTSTDRILLEHVRRATGSCHLISERVVRNRQWKQQYQLRIGSKEWYLDLLTLGFTSRKSHTLRFPKIPGSYLGDFVRGYFDGDGCVYLGSTFAKDRGHRRWVFQTQFISGSRTFLESLWAALRTGEIHGGHIYVRKSGAANLVFSWKDSLALYRIMYNTGLVSGLYLPRKREKFEEAFEALTLRP